MTCRQFTINLDPSQTGTLLTIALSDFVSKKCIITAADEGGGRTEAYELFMTYTGDPGSEVVSFTTYANVGDTIDHTIDVTNNAGQVEVTITNNETARIRFDLAELGQLV